MNLKKAALTVLDRILQFVLPSDSPYSATFMIDSRPEEEELDG